MQVQRLVWLGVPTQHFDETVAFFQHILDIDLELQAQDFAVLRLSDGGTIEVFGPSLAVQEQFTTGRVVGIEVTDVVAARSKLEQTGIHFIGPIHQGEGGAAWSHFYGPEGQVYELTQVAKTESNTSTNTSHSATRFLNPPTMPQAIGYTQVVETHGCRTVYIAGQVALDTAGNVVGIHDALAQTTQVFTNLRAALEAVGATFEHVVKLTYFLLDITHLPIVRSVRDQFINTQQPPASSAVEVRRLFRDELLIEIEAIAVIPESNIYR